MAGKFWASGYQKYFYFFSTMIFDRVMSKNVILKRPKILQNRHYVNFFLRVSAKDLVKKVTPPLKKLRAKIQISGFTTFVYDFLAFITRKDFVEKRNTYIFYSHI